LSAVLTIGKMIKETLQLQSLCMKYMEIKFMTCSTTTKR